MLLYSFSFALISRFLPTSEKRMGHYSNDLAVDSFNREPEEGRNRVFFVEGDFSLVSEKAELSSFSKDSFSCEFLLIAISLGLLDFPSFVLLLSFK